MVTERFQYNEIFMSLNPFLKNLDLNRLALIISYITQRLLLLILKDTVLNISFVMLLKLGKLFNFRKILFKKTQKELIKCVKNHMNITCEKEIVDKN